LLRRRLPVRSDWRRGSPMMVSIEEREYARLLGYPWGTLLEGDARELAEHAADWYLRYGKPRVYCLTSDRTHEPKESNQEQRASFLPAFRVAGITAGLEVDVEVERLWAAGRVDEAYFLDRYGAGVVEKLAADLGPYRSPGTGKIPFEYQWTLFS